MTTQAAQPTPETPSSSRVLPVWVCLALSLILRGFFVLEPPGRDQSLFMVQGSLLLDGQRLYADIWEHKPPGVIAAYALAMAVLGRDAVAMHALGWLAGLGTALGIWALVAQTSKQRWPAAVAAGLYLVFQQNPAVGGYWSIAQAEVLMDPLLVGALWLVVTPGDPQKRGLRLVAAGILGSLVLLLKYSALPMVAGLGVLAVLASGQVLPTLGWLVVGGVVPPVALAVYLLATGSGEAFWTATVTFNQAHRLMGVYDRTQLLGDRILWRYAALLPLYAIAALGGIWTLRRRLQGDLARAWLAGIFLWVCALAEVFWQGKFWVYQYQVVILPLCLLSGAGLGMLRIAWPTRPRLLRGLATGLVVVSLVPTLALTWAYVQEHGVIGRWRGTVSWMQFWSTYRWNGTDYDYGENALVAAEVARKTQPTDSIFVWGFEPAVYQLSGRAPASRFLYDYPLSPHFDQVHAGFTQALLDDLKRTRPAMFLVLHRDRSRIEPKESAEQLEACPEIKAYLAENFVFAGRLGDFGMYGRR